MILRNFVRVALLVVFLLAASACGQSSPTTTTAPTVQSGATLTSEATTPAGEGAASTATTAPTGPPDATESTITATTEGEDVATTSTAVPDYGRVLTIMTHDSFDISADVVAEFERANEVNIRFLQAGDAGSVLNRAILSKGNPLADVLYGVDNTFFSRAIAADIFEPYKPAALANVPAELQLDPEGRLTPIDTGYVTFNYDQAAFGEGKLPVPETLRDLTRPEYKGKIVVPSPATSSPGLAFLLTTIAAFGEQGDYPWTQFWADLRANDVQVVEGWETAYYTNFSGSSGKGPQPIVLSYATSPAAEVYFSEGALSEPPTANLLVPGGTFQQIEFAGILRGTEQGDLARRWIDYMLSPRFQEDIPLHMFVYPVNDQVALPDLFEQFAPIPDEPATLPPDQVAANRDRWIQEWTRIMQQ